MVVANTAMVGSTAPRFHVKEQATTATASTKQNSLIMIVEVLIVEGVKDQ